MDIEQIGKAIIEIIEKGGDKALWALALYLGFRVIHLVVLLGGLFLLFRTLLVLVSRILTDYWRRQDNKISLISEDLESKIRSLLESSGEEHGKSLEAISQSLEKLERLLKKSESEEK